MYREALWRNLRLIQETRRQKNARSKNAEDNATRDGSADNETTSDDVFHDLTQTSDIPPAHSISNTGIITKNFEISSDHNHAKNNHAMKSIEEIVESVPKSYPIRNSSDSSYDSLPSENCSESDVESEKTNSGNFSIKFKNQKNDIFRNIEAWRKNIVTEKANQNEDEQATAEEKKDLPKFDSTTDRDKTNTNVSQTSSIFENSTTHVLAKEVNSEFTHTFPLSRSPTPKNEFTGSFKRLTSSQCPTCGGLSCRPTAEGVDEVDCHCR
ncbi:hypothetical protein ALC57_02693 [Trachymyrmex cornetzi]|uniref:Uncharacterized protein n=1 Tax=Trachymyrmex cornetzi TaxID=471704 RepID=A0A151JNM9_9HYME|nr:hypothetical protein ALC57_02693 [Trachymyrmex cornetzi]